MIYTIQNGSLKYYFTEGNLRAFLALKSSHSYSELLMMAYAHVVIDTSANQTIKCKIDLERLMDSYFAAPSSLAEP